MGFVLTFIAFLLSILVYPVAILTTFIKRSYNQHIGVAVDIISQQFFDIATSIDATGNVVCEDLFNLILIKKNGYKFGNRKETISSVLGKNQRDNTLIFAGKLLAGFLDICQKNHCKRSIDDNV